MSYENYQQVQILDHCWSNYLLLSASFIISESFHTQYPILVESALISRTLRINLKTAESYNLHIREEYSFFKGSFKINSYSYTLVSTNDNVIFRADGLPHHKTDYKGQPLSHPPHHVHDRNGRICSFCGSLQEFITEIKNITS